jgi:ubiquinone/menaquinone biosynthesis C-methylase UbiE
MSRDDVRTNLASWEADSAGYQARNSSQLNRWDGVTWGTWAIPESDVNALGDVTGLRALELGCGAAQVGLNVVRAGASVIGLDFSANQLAAARMNVADTGERFPLVRASAEELPFADGTFDLVFCDHGATSFTDPHVTIPECARVLRSGGRLVFNIATPWVAVCWPNDEDPPDRTLHRPYYELGRSESEEDGMTSVEWYLGYGDMIRIFREAGFEIEDLIELRPMPEAASTYTTYATLDWARDFPGDHIWKLRKG